MLNPTFLDQRGGSLAINDAVTVAYPLIILSPPIEMWSGATFAGKIIDESAHKETKSDLPAQKTFLPP